MSTSRPQLRLTGNVLWAVQVLSRADCAAACKTIPHRGDLVQPSPCMLIAGTVQQSWRG